MTISVAFHAWSERPATPAIFVIAGSFWGKRNVEPVPKQTRSGPPVRVNNEAEAEAFRVIK